MTDPEAGVHPAARSFGSVAVEYDRARPEYPPEAVHALQQHLGLRQGRRLLELGSGTGKLTRPLVTTGVDLVVVEPSEGMRAIFRRHLPDVRLLDGTAEAIPLADASVDAVVAGQAFHWFRQPDALNDIARVLRRGGGLGLVWNRRDVRAPWVAEFGKLLDPYEGHDVPRIQHGTWKAAFEGHPAFPPLDLVTFPWFQEGDAATFVDRALSVSFVASQSPETRKQIADAVRALLATHPDTRGRSTFRMPYVTEVYWSHRR